MFLWSLTYICRFVCVSQLFVHDAKTFWWRFLQWKIIVYLKNFESVVGNLLYTNVCWHKAFSEGRPSNSVNDDNDEETVFKNCLVGNKEIADNLNIFYGSTQCILVNILEIKRVNARLVPKELNYLHIRCRVKVAKEMLDNIVEDAAWWRDRCLWIWLRNCPTFTIRWGAPKMNRNLKSQS